MMRSCNSYRKLVAILFALGLSGTAVAAPPEPARPVSPGTIDAVRAEKQLYQFHRVQQKTLQQQQALQRQQLAQQQMAERQRLTVDQMVQQHRMETTHKLQHEQRVEQRGLFE